MSDGPVRPGQVWEFVHASGKAVEYVVEYVESATWGNASSVRLLNGQTGKCAHVSVGWLRREPGPTGSHWRFVSEPVQAEAA